MCVMAMVVRGERERDCCTAGLWSDTFSAMDEGIKWRDGPGMEGPSGCCIHISLSPVLREWAKRHTGSTAAPHTNERHSSGPSMPYTSLHFTSISPPINLSPVTPPPLFSSPPLLPSTSFSYK